MYFQLKGIEMERTQKWLKMIKQWDKYYPGVKVCKSYNTLQYYFLMLHKSTNSFKSFILVTFDTFLT